MVPSPFKSNYCSCYIKMCNRLPWWLSGEESPWQCMGQGFNSWSGKIPHATGQLSLSTTTTETCEPRACAPQEKHYNEKPVYATKSSPSSSRPEKACNSNKNPAQQRINKPFKKSSGPEGLSAAVLGVPQILVVRGHLFLPDPCIWLAWVSSQHGGFRVLALLTQQMASLWASTLRDTSRGGKAPWDLASELTQPDFSRILLIRAVISQATWGGSGTGCNSGSCVEGRRKPWCSAMLETGHRNHLSLSGWL